MGGGTTRRKIAPQKKITAETAMRLLTTLDE